MWRRRLGAKEGLAPVNGRSSRPLMRLRACLKLKFCSRPLSSRGSCRSMRHAVPTRRSIRWVHKVRRYRGQAEVVKTLLRLMAGSAIRESHRKGNARVHRALPTVAGETNAPLTSHYGFRVSVWFVPALTPITAPDRSAFIIETLCQLVAAQYAPRGRIPG